MTAGDRIEIGEKQLIMIDEMMMIVHGVLGYTVVGLQMG